MEEALTVCKGRILVNVDHGWNYFDQVMEVAKKVGCVDQIIFKSGGTRQATAEAMQQCKDAGIFYMPIDCISMEDVWARIAGRLSIKASSICCRTLI